MRKIILLLLVIGTCIGLYLIFQGYHEQTENIIGYGTIEAREIHVGSRIGGRVSEVHIRESDIVREGQLLITLESQELTAQRKEALAALKAAEARESELHAGYREELIRKAEAQMKERELYLKEIAAKGEKEIQKAKMEIAQIEYDHAEKEYRRLDSQSDVSDQQREAIKKARDIAKARLHGEKQTYVLLCGQEEIARQQFYQAQAEYDRLCHGPSIQEKQQATAVKEEIEARLERIETQIRECKICAPSTSGVKETGYGCGFLGDIIALYPQWAPEVGRVEISNLEKGDILAIGQTAVTLLKPADLWVKVYVKEYELDRVRVGQEVEVLMETSRRKDERSLGLKILYSLTTPPPETRVFPGRIVHIASQAEFTPRNVQTKEERGHQVFAVKVEILNPEAILRPGIAVTVREKQ